MCWILIMYWMGRRVEEKRHRENEGKALILGKVADLGFMVIKHFGKLGCSNVVTYAHVCTCHHSSCCSWSGRTFVLPFSYAHNWTLLHCMLLQWSNNLFSVFVKMHVLSCCSVWLMLVPGNGTFLLLWLSSIFGCIWFIMMPYSCCTPPAFSGHSELSYN